MAADRVKPLEFRRLATRARLRMRVRGPLATKGGLRARRLESLVRQQIVEATQLWRWKCAPRAKMAVSFRFFDQEKNHPDVHSLTKFYLDCLKAIVFRDDRQVHYLDVSTHRFRAEEGESSLFMDVWRLTDYERSVQLGGGAKAPYEDKEHFPHQIYHLHPDDWEMAVRQHQALAGSPVLSHNKAFGLPSLMDIFRDAHPMIFDLGGLPTSVGTLAFADRIREAMELHASQRKLLSKIYIPVELNAQVTKQAFGLAKDLDNVMRTVCRTVAQRLLHPTAYISGYRVYVIDDVNVPPRLSVQILPVGAIETYARQIDARFEAYGEQLND